MEEETFPPSLARSVLGRKGVPGRGSKDRALLGLEDEWRKRLGLAQDAGVDAGPGRNGRDWAWRVEEVLDGVKGSQRIGFGFVFEGEKGPTLSC